MGPAAAKRPRRASISTPEAPEASPTERKACLDGLRQAAAEGLTTARQLQSRRPSVYLEALRIWGDIRSARTAAGLDNPVGKPVTWTEEVIIAELQRLAAAGLRMSSRDLFLAGHSTLLSSATARFGGLRAARKAAGLEVPARARPGKLTQWTAASVLRALRKRHRAGETLAPASVPSALYAIALRYHGTWRAAMEAAGLNYRTAADSPRWREEELIAWLRTQAKRHPTSSLTEVRELKGAAAVIERWGSLQAGAAAAGLEGWPVAKYEAVETAEAVVKLLREEAAAGRKRPSSRARYHALRVFGDWATARKAAGVFVPTRGPEARAAAAAKRPTR